MESAQGIPGPSAEKVKKCAVYYCRSGGDARGGVRNFTDYSGKGFLLCVDGTDLCNCGGGVRYLHEKIQVAERSQNRAIVLLNKVKLKYINVANAVDYACEKYHVKSAGELENQWQYYLEAVKERQKYQRTNEDLEYFNGRLVRMLSNYQLYDAHVWVTQAVALVDPKEMVEIKHGLIGRRQKLRARIENNLSQVNEQKEEAEQLLDKVGSMRPQMEKILNAVDKINEGD